MFIFGQQISQMSQVKQSFDKDFQYYKFCLYGFLKNLRLFEPFLILFFLENNLSFLQIGFLYSIREITRNILEIPAGIISDSLGRKRTMIFSFGFYIVSFVIFFFSEVYAIFALAMIIYALGDAFRTGTHKAMIFDYLKIKGWQDQKVFYYGHTRSWSQFGSAISAIIAGILVFYSGDYKIIFLYSAIPYILDLIIIASYPKELDGEVARFSKGQIFSSIKKVLKDFMFSLINLKILKSIANLSAFTGYFRALKDYLQPVLQTLALSLPVLVFLDDKQRSSVVIGLIYFLIYVLTSFSSRNSGRFSSRFKFLNIPLNVTILIGFIVGILTGIFYESGFIIIAVILFVGIYMIENLRKPIGIAYITENVKTDILATVLSTESQFHSLVAAVIAPVIGFFADRFGLGYAIIFASSILLISGPLYLLKKKQAK